MDSRTMTRSSDSMCAFIVGVSPSRATQRGRTDPDKSVSTSRSEWRMTMGQKDCGQKNDARDLGIPLP